MSSEHPDGQLWRGDDPKVPDDWHFLLMENLTSFFRLLAISQEAGRLSLGSFVEKGYGWRRNLPLYDAGCEAALDKAVDRLAGGRSVACCPLFLFWISPQEVIQDARLRTIIRGTGCRSLGDFVEKGVAWRMGQPGFGSKAEEALQHHVNNLIRRTPSQALRQVGELACLLQHDAAALCRRLLQADAVPEAFPPRLLKIRALEEVDLLRFLCIFRPDWLGSGQDPKETYSKQDILMAFPSEERESVELELYIRAESLLSLRHWTPEICRRFVPSWVLDRMVVASTSSPILVRRAERYKWRCYADLLGDTRRIELPAFGDEVESLLWGEVDRLARQGSVWDQHTSIHSLPHDLMGAVKATMQRLSPRSSRVLSDRMGLQGSEPQTLRQLGQRLGVTRERIRQIEQDAWKQIRRREAWASAFAAQLEQLLGEHCGIVAVSLLHSDPWMQQAAKREAVLSTLARRLLTEGAYLYPGHGQSYILELRRTHFDRLRLIFNQHIRKQHFPVPLQTLIERLGEVNPFPIPRPGFIARFLSIFGPPLDLHEDGQVLGLRNSVPSRIKRILYQAASPIHFEDIHQALTQEVGLTEQVSIHQVRHHLLSDPMVHLFGPGLYGLDRHFPDRQMLASQCIPAALQIMRSAPQARFSAKVLLQGLKSELGLPEWFTRYHLGILLRRCPEASYHGRLAFSARGGRSQESGVRNQEEG